jgi:hypothetical protein
LKGRCLISLLLPLLLFGVSCTQQPEKKGVPEKIAREKSAPARKTPLKIIHLAGETTSVNPRAGRLTVRGKDGDVDIYATEKTIIRIGRDPRRLSDIAAGNKATVKYLEIGGKNVARSIYIAPEAPEVKEPPKAETPPPPPSEKITPEQPPSDSQKLPLPPS